MKKIWLGILVIVCCNNGFAQTNVKGFEALFFAKNSIEDVVKQFISSVPDSSKAYKKAIFLINEQYSKARASYEGYRGFMVDCILNNKNEKKIRYCLKGKFLDVSFYIDSLQTLVNNAYIEEFANNPIEVSHQPTNKNVSIITSDFIKMLIEDLSNSGIKIWNEAKKFKKEYKDSYIERIKSSEFALQEFNTLISNYKKNNK